MLVALTYATMSWAILRLYDSAVKGRILVHCAFTVDILMVVFLLCIFERFCFMTVYGLGLTKSHRCLAVMVVLAILLWQIVFPRQSCQLLRLKAPEWTTSRTFFQALFRSLVEDGKESAQMKSLLPFSTFNSLRPFEHRFLKQTPLWSLHAFLSPNDYEQAELSASSR